MFTALDYGGNQYADYVYPTWATFVGWLITFSSVIAIPAVALHKLLNEEGTLKEVKYRVTWIMFNERRYFS